MLFNLKHNADLLFGVIPPLQLEEHQIAGMDMGCLPTHGFVRSPSTIDELRPYWNEMVIGMDNRTLVLLNFHRLFRKGRLVHVSMVKFFQMEFRFDGRTEISFKIFGDSEDDIMETVLFFASLEISAERKLTNITISCYRDLNLNSSHAGQFASFLDAAASKDIKIAFSHPNTSLLSVIATKSYPIDMTMFISKTDIDTLLQHLQNRTTIGGSLSLMDFNLELEDLLQIWDHLHLFESIRVNEVSDELLLKLLAAPIKRLAFHLHAEVAAMDLTSVDIVPTDIRLTMFSNWVTPKGFLLAFFRRMAQLGHMERLEIASFIDRPVPGDVGKALIDAVTSSKNLRHLELTSHKNEFDPVMQSLFAVIENHQELRTLVISGYPKQLDPDFLWLQHLLKRNRRIEITGPSARYLEVNDEVERLFALNRFFRGSQSLTRDPPSNRPSLVGNALTESAASNFQRTGLLLTDQADTLCELLQGIV